MAATSTSLQGRPVPLPARPEIVETTSLQRIVPGHGKSIVVPWGVRKSLGPVFLALLWWYATASGAVSEDFLPGPAALWSALQELYGSGELGEALKLSLARASAGFGFGFTVGVGLALVSGLLRIGEDLVDAPMQMMRTLPWAGLVPLLIIWLGIDETPKITLVAFAVCFPLYVNTFAGIRNVDRNLIEAAKTLQFSRTAMIFEVVLPGALPGLLVGLRYSLGSAWLALVFAETVNAQGGLGYLITHAREVYRVDIIILCLFIYALLGLSADLIVRFLEKILLSWRQGFEGE
jgi:sulfonate transport system permease protein